MGRSLGGDMMVDVMFNLGFFALEGTRSLYMKELYYVYVDLYSEQEERRD